MAKNLYLSRSAQSKISKIEAPNHWFVHNKLGNTPMQEVVYLRERERKFIRCVRRRSPTSDPHIPDQRMSGCFNWDSEAHRPVFFTWTRTSSSPTGKNMSEYSQVMRWEQRTLWDGTILETNAVGLLEDERGVGGHVARVGRCREQRGPSWNGRIVISSIE